jgi:hypothetical protein
MKAKYAIQELARLNPDEEIVIAYWDRNWFINNFDRHITDKEWEEITDKCETVLEYAGLGEDMHAAAVEALDELAEQETTK